MPACRSQRNETSPSSKPRPSGDEAADKHDVCSHESEGADDVSCFGGQLIGDVRVVASEVSSVRFVQESAP